MSTTLSARRQVQGRSSSLIATRWRAATTILRRDLRALLLSPGGYVALALAGLVVGLDVRNDLEAIATSRLLVMADAFTRSYFIATMLLIFFLALAAAATIAREREQGTLEVLFYGPVDHWSYLVGKHLALLGAYLLFGLGLVLVVVLYAALTGLRLGSGFGPIVLLSIVAAAAVAAGGIAVSTLVRGVRAALALLLVIIVALLAISVGASLLSGLQVTNNTNPLLFLRDLVIGLDQVIAYASPIATYERGIDAAVRGNPVAYLAWLLLLVLHSGLLLGVALISLRRRGVRR